MTKKVRVRAKKYYIVEGYDKVYDRIIEKELIKEMREEATFGNPENMLYAIKCEYGSARLPLLVHKHTDYWFGILENKRWP